MENQFIGRDKNEEEMGKIIDFSLFAIMLCS